MCSYLKLYHNDKTGYVVRCRECSHFQVAYGNIMLTVSMEGFREFHRLLKEVMCEQDRTQNEAVRNIALSTPCEGIKLLLSIRELTEFNEMLEDADTELQSLNIINLFNGNG